jgi:hypothetical protein
MHAAAGIVDDVVRVVDAMLRFFADGIAKAAAASGDDEIVATMSDRRHLWELLADGYLAPDEGSRFGFRPVENRAERQVLRQMYRPLVACYLDMVRHDAMELSKRPAGSETSSELRAAPEIGRTGMETELARLRANVEILARAVDRGDLSQPESKILRFELAAIRAATTFGEIATAAGILANMADAHQH